MRYQKILGSVLAVVISLILVVAVSAKLTETRIKNLEMELKAKGATFRVGVNPATEKDLSQLCGLVPPKNWWVGASFGGIKRHMAAPSSWNWCDQGGCPPINDQGNCGSCWAFATVGLLESNILIKNGIVKDLSEQYLVSCNTDNWGCTGGWWAHDYHQWKFSPPESEAGAVPESEFPYVAFESPCGGPYSHPWKIDNWAFISESLFQGRHGQTANEYQQSFVDLTSQGYRLICVDTHVIDSIAYYASAWIYDPGSPFQGRHGQTATEYQQSFDDLTSQGYRLICVDTHVIDSIPYYASAWILDVSIESIKQAILDYGPVAASVHVGTAFRAYTGGVFNTNETGEVNHGVVLVGWDDNQGMNGVWILRNSWGDLWGESGYMRIQYGCSLIGYAANYIVYSGEPEPCECDLNSDGKCDMQDWLKFGEDWGRTDCGTPPGSGDPPNDCECDLNTDGKCDMQDWLLFGEDWGRTDCPTP